MRRLDFILYGTFLIVIGLLSWIIIDTKRNINKNIGIVDPYVKVEKDYFGKVIPEFSLPSVMGEKPFTFSPNKNNTFYLFIFFTPWDCHDCFQEIPFWKQIEEKFQNKLQVLAIGTADSIDIFRYFVEKNNISILTLYDEEQQLFKKLSLKDSFLTPAKLLTNSNGAILHISSSTYQNQKLQQQYLDLLDKILLLND